MQVESLLSKSKLDDIRIVYRGKFYSYRNELLRILEPIYLCDFMTPIIMRLSRYSDIKFSNERAFPPSQEIAINTKLLHLTKYKQLQQKNRQIKMHKRSRKWEISNSIYEFEDILSEISTRIDRIDL
jgi:hypothetical protein